MIIMDYSQIAISSILAQLGNHKNTPLTVDLIRHMILNVIRANVVKYRSKYGNLVIACDTNHSWRKDCFEFYKANRKKERDKSEIDWATLFSAINTVRDELKENFKYPVVHVEGSEADDIIGVLCDEYGAQLGDGDERILILSGDKDFGQLQKYSNVDQVDPVRNKKIKIDNPSDFLIDHIIKGDSSDGVPNILSADNIFTRPERQVVMTAKRVEEARAAILSGDLGDYKDKYNRNRLMVDLSKTPSDIREEIKREYESQSNKKLKPGSIFNYMVSKKLKVLMESVGDF